MRISRPTQARSNSTTCDKLCLIPCHIDRTAVTRLLHIANHCPTLAPSALQLALQHILQSSNTALYINTVQDHNNLPSTTDPLPVDQKWIEEVSAKNASEKNRLEVELKQYTSNMIKESIRVRRFWHHRLFHWNPDKGNRWDIEIWATFTALQATTTRHSKTTPNRANSARPASMSLTCVHLFSR
jgi:hypothetical protein